MKKSITKNAIVRYLIICFCITYLSWGCVAFYSRAQNVNFNTYTWMLILYVLGVISPAISAIFVERTYEKKKYIIGAGFGILFYGLL